jgi:ankyrin repeat protein
MSHVSPIIGNLRRNQTDYTLELDDPTDAFSDTARLFKGECVAFSQASEIVAHEAFAMLEINRTLDKQNTTKTLIAQIDPSSLEFIVGRFGPSCSVWAGSQHIEVRLCSVLVSSPVLCKDWNNLDVTDFQIGDENVDILSILEELWKGSEIKITFLNAQRLQNVGEALGWSWLVKAVEEYEAKCHASDAIFQLHIDGLNAIVDLQQRLICANNETINDIVKWITESPWVSNPESVKELAGIICAVAEGRPDLGAILAQICQRLTILRADPLQVLAGFLGVKVWQKATNSRGFFIYHLFKFGIITLESIRHFAVRFVHTPNTTTIDTRLLCWFLPELMKVVPWKWLQQIFSCHRKALLKNGKMRPWLVYKQARELGIAWSEFALMLRNDDFEGLQLAFADKKLTLMSKLDPSIFESIGSTFIFGYCARWRSKRCVKYLLMNKFVETHDDLREAVIGGDAEIIRQLQHAKGDPVVLVYAAIESFHPSVLEWVLETRFSTVEIFRDLNNIIEKTIACCSIECLFVLQNHGPVVNSQSREEHFCRLSAESGYSSLFHVILSFYTRCDGFWNDLKVDSLRSWLWQWELPLYSDSDMSWWMTSWQKPSSNDVRSTRINNIDEIFEYAVSGGNIDLVHFIMANMKEITPRLLVLLARVSIRYGHADLFEMFQNHPNILKNGPIFKSYLFEFLENRRVNFLPWVRQWQMGQSDWLSALEIACQYGFIEALPLLYEKLSPNVNLDSCLTRAALSCCVEAWQFIKERWPSLTNSDDHPLILAIKYRNIAVLDFLLTLPDMSVTHCGSDICKAVEMAICTESQDIYMRVLNHKSFNVHGPLGDRALNVAASHNLSNLVQKLQKMREETPMVALPESLAILRSDPIANDPMDQLRNALEKSPDAVALALNLSGIEINEPFTNGRLPLTSISRSNPLPYLQLLLKFPGIDVNGIDRNGDFALLCFCGNHEALSFLLRHPSININVASPFTGETALLRLARHYDQNDDLTHKIHANRNRQNHDFAQGILTLLSIPDIDINARDCSGRTALMYLIGFGFRAGIEVLLNREDIDLSITDYDNITWKAMRNFGYFNAMIKDMPKDASRHLCNRLGYISDDYQ